MVAGSELPLQLSNLQPFSSSRENSPMDREYGWRDQGSAGSPVRMLSVSLSVPSAGLQEQGSSGFVPEP